MSQTGAIISKLLTDVSQGYVPQGFISEIALTPLKSKQSTGKIGKYGTQHLRFVPSLMGGKGVARRYEVRQYNSDSYSIEPYGLEDVITPEEYENVELPFDAEKDVTMQLSTLIFLGKELAFKTAMTTAANYAAANKATLAGVTQWSDYSSATSVPVQNINTAKAAIRANGGVADTLIADDSVINALRYHPQLVRALGFADAGIETGLSDVQLAKALKLKRVLVADVIYDTSKEGQTASLTPLWGRFAILAALPEKPSKFQKSMGYMITRSSEAPRKVYKAPVSNPPESTQIIVKDSYDIVIVDYGLGYLWTDAIA